MTRDRVQKTLIVVAPERGRKYGIFIMNNDVIIYVHDVLPNDRERSVTGKRLCDLLNIDRRQLYENVETERRAGWPICASKGKDAGYWMAESEEEVQKYCVAELLKAARKMEETADMLRENLRL